MKRVFYYLHLWLSLPLGFFFVLICITGSILVFQEELLEWTYPERYFVKEVRHNRLPLDSLVSSANSHLQGRDTITNVQFFSDPQRTVALVSRHWPRRIIYADPYTGKIVGEYDRTKGFFYGVMSLHRWLMVPDRSIGKQIVGWATVGYIVILLSGLLIWLPRRLSRVKSCFSVKWHSTGWSRRIYDLHRVVGVYVAGLVLLLSLTGLMWSFEAYRNQVARQLGVVELLAKKGKDRGKGSFGFHWEQACQVFHQSAIVYEWVRLDDGGGIQVHVPGAVHKRDVDSYRLVRKNNRYGLEAKAKEWDRRAVMGWAYILHTGAWGGAWGKWVTFIGSLLAASLPITGYLLYFRRQRR